MKDCDVLNKIVLNDKNVIPQCGLGTYGIEKKDLINLLKNYTYDKLLIDTAYRYGNEEIVGQAILNATNLKNKIQYIGKICYAQQITTSVEEALNTTLMNLGIKSIDFYLIHSPRYKFYTDTWMQMIQLRNKGLIKYIGVSNFSVKDLKVLYRCSGIYPILNQIQYECNDFYELIHFCNEKHIIIQIVMLFGGLGKFKLLSNKECMNRINFILKNNISCIFGTSNIDHMKEDFSYFTTT